MRYGYCGQARAQGMEKRADCHCHSFIPSLEKICTPRLRSVVLSSQSKKDLEAGHQLSLMNSCNSSIPSRDTPGGGKKTEKNITLAIWLDDSYAYPASLSPPSPLFSRKKTWATIHSQFAKIPSQTIIDYARHENNL